MSSTEPSANGGVPPKPDPPEKDAEPVEPLYLELDDIPTVEIVDDYEPVRRRKPGFGILKALLWCLLFLLLTQVVPGVVAIVPVVLMAILDNAQGALTKGDLLKSVEFTRAMQVALVLGPLCGAILSLFLLRRVVGRSWKRRIALRFPHIEHVVLVILISLPLFVMNGALQWLLVSLFGERLGVSEYEEVMKSIMSWPVWLLILAIGIGPAISEELWCRGFLGQGLANRYGVWGGVLVTSFLFGLIHMQPLQSTIAAIMGVALHLVYLASRSILIPMLLHFLHNSITVLGEVKDSPLPIGKSLEHALEHQPALMVVASAFFALAIGLAIYQSRVRIESPFGGDLPRAVRCHVELPQETSGIRMISGPISNLVIGLLIASACFFAAIWFGV